MDGPTERQRVEEELRQREEALRQREEDLRQREEELRFIANGMPVLISYVDAEQHYRFNNKIYEEWFGDSLAQIEGRHIRDVVGEVAYQQILPHVEAALAGREVQFDLWVEYRGAGWRWVEARYIPHFGPYGEVRGFFVLVNNISERKKTEAALRASEEALAAADRRKDEFLAMLAHELRNPLAPIRNALAVTHLLGPHDPRLDRMHAVIERQVGQLTRLVDDLLDIARISQGKIALHREALDLAAVIAHAVEISRPLVDAGGHRLSLELPAGPLRIEGDAARLTQVLSNLLNNAAKYTEAGGTIRLTAEERGNEVEIHVIDDGIGIPSDVLPRVFDLYAQADRARDRAQGGLGIGLALVRRIVELHGGTVEAASAGPGHGSDFSVRLPRLAG